MKIEKLKSLTQISAGYPLRGSTESLETGDVHLIQMRNITPHLLVDWPSVAKVVLPTKREPVWLEESDVIFAARGAKNYAVSFDQLPPKTVCSPHFFVLRVRTLDKLLPNFLAWQINQKPAQDYFARTATGSHIANIRRNAIENLEIVIPSLYKQKMIAELWDSALEEKRLVQALIENRDQQMEAVAADLLYGRMR